MSFAIQRHLITIYSLFVFRPISFFQLQQYKSGAIQNSIQGDGTKENHDGEKVNESEKLITKM